VGLLTIGAFARAAGLTSSPQSICFIPSSDLAGQRKRGAEWRSIHPLPRQPSPSPRARRPERSTLARWATTHCHAAPRRAPDGADQRSFVARCSEVPDRTVK